MGILLSAPKYFKLETTEKGTKLVSNGYLEKIGISEKYGNEQFYFREETGGLVCLNGGQIKYAVNTHNLDDTKLLDITYDGTEVMTNGKFKGKNAHQFIIELNGERAGKSTTNVAIHQSEMDLE